MAMPNSDVDELPCASAIARVHGRSTVLAEHQAGAAVTVAGKAV